MAISDALSRCSDLYLEKDDGNKQVTIFLDIVFANLIDLDLQQGIKKANLIDHDAEKVISLLNNLIHRTNTDKWTLKNLEGEQMPFYAGKQYIPNEIKL